MAAYRWADKKKVDRKGQEVQFTGLDKVWSVTTVPGGGSLLVAGNTAVVGGPNVVRVVDLASKAVTWSAAVEGVPYGVAWANGRLIVEGTDGLRSVDAYNGRTLREFAIPNVLKAYNQEHLMGAAGTGSNFCVSADGLFVRTAGKCFRLDPTTGRNLGEFDAPARSDNKPATWGFLATDGGTVFGSVADDSHLVKFPYGRSDMSELFTESVNLFAVDALAGSRKWVYAARHSIRHNAIAVGGGRVYLIDRPKAEMDRPDADKTTEHPPGENAIPAGGVVLVPDASAACSCSYRNRAWVALQPLEPAGKERPRPRSGRTGTTREPVSAGGPGQLRVGGLRRARGAPGRARRAGAHRAYRSRSRLAAATSFFNFR